MAWFRKPRKGLKAQPKKEFPNGLWLKCDGCGEILYRKELERNLMVCTKCEHHFRIGSSKYVEILLDPGSAEEVPMHVRSGDPLAFPDYKEKLTKTQEKTQMQEGITVTTGAVNDYQVVLAVTDFAFMGGSMGSVVGEMVANAIRIAQERHIPLVIVTASGGGARMQEGILSLMQMAKTSAHLAELAREKVPYITILTHPTMAGVMASFASLGDVILAEPGALLGFTGPRVIEQTIREELPDGFQRSEFLLEHGMVDVIVKRHDLKKVLAQLLSFFLEADN
jgi:acetyl-CoA carboxylase carboxyl transferase subunit beta